MKYSISIVFLAALLIGTLTPYAHADEELSSMHDGFVLFAREKITSLDRSHAMSKTRMQVVKEGEYYRARYHAFDKASLKCKVRRSRSTSVPFVGTMTFNVMVKEAVAKTPAEFDGLEFVTVQIKPNRQIFGFKGGDWQ